MKHFQTAEWADFVRGVATAEISASMQAHLNAGCQSCQATLNWCKTLAVIAQREAAYEPPEAAIRIAQAWFALSRPDKGMLARVVFDTSLQPALAGVRSAHAGPRQVVYEAGDVVVDIKLEPIDELGNLHIIGQLIQRDDPYAFGHVPVVLREADKQVAKTFTNRFGEFQFESGPHLDLALGIALPQAQIIEVPLRDAKRRTNP
jgi:hypothetical protein